LVTLKYFILYNEPTSDGGNAESNGTPPGSSTTGIGDGDNKPSVLVSLNRLFCNTAHVIMYPIQPDVYGNYILNFHGIITLAR
jgi:hypothetical protein